MENYNPQALPNMTVEQAMFILRTPYNEYPEGIRIQAAAIATAMQEWFYRNTHETGGKGV